MRQSIERELRQTFRELRAEHPQLAAVSFKVNGRFKRRLGVCRYARLTRYGEAPRPVSIEVARYAVESPELHDDVRDTLLHEVAHAIAGHKAGHGPVWKAVCVEIGAKPKRCVDLTVEQREAVAKATDPKWTIRCEACDVTGHAHRATLKRRTWGRCRGCRGAMTWTNNRTGEVTHSNPNWPPRRRPTADPLSVMLGDLLNN